MRYFLIGVPEVHINWKRVGVEEGGVETAIADAYEVNENAEETDEFNFSKTLEMDEFLVRLPNGDEVSSEEAIDRESSGEMVGGD